MSRADLKPVIQDTVTLPSKGLVYENVPETFSIRPMTVNELKMLYGVRNTMVALDNIIESVVQLGDFPVKDLLAGDKVYLAYMIRAITFGETYKATSYCPNCGKQQKVEFNLLKDIEIDYLPDGFVNPRNIGKLPKSQDEICVKLLTSKDFDNIIKRTTEINKKFPDFVGDPTYHVAIAAQIDSVNGKKMTQTELEDYVLDLHAMDDIYLTQKIKEVSFGPKSPVEVACPECGESMYVRIDIAEDFFRPELEF